MKLAVDVQAHAQQSLVHAVNGDSVGDYGNA